MKLIIQQYLASLKEREELDAILPDLLSQLGLNVYSTPGRGTRQDGVDVGAVGKLGDDSEEKVYLFSIKAGYLTRNDWDGDALQSLRPSLNEIVDAYIPNRLPPEHQGKKIVICLCFGGVIKEQVRPSVVGYIEKNTTEDVCFEEWNGDKLAELIQANFLREELLPKEARSYFRKSLALIDEPESSCRHFTDLLRSLIKIDFHNDKKALTTVRQIYICLWIHYSWARDAENIESTYLVGELALLYGWEITKKFAGKAQKIPAEIQSTFQSITDLYHQIIFTFSEEKVAPFIDKKHALSVAVRGNCDLDINLRLFDILGRLAMGGLWTYSIIQKIDEDSEVKNRLVVELYKYSDGIKHLVANNPCLKLPIKDDQTIDISLAVLLLLIDDQSNDFVGNWLGEILNRAEFTLKTNGKYPCNLQSYNDLLDHPLSDDEHLKENTCGSILYPFCALCANIIDNERLYNKVQSIKKDLLPHCNLQLWFPSDDSEEHIYLNSDGHGAALSDLNLEQSLADFANQVFGECDKSNAYSELSACNYGLWPILLVACRHYRLPLPIHPFRDLRISAEEKKQKI